MSKNVAKGLFKGKTNIYVTECLSTNDFLINILKKNDLDEGSLVITDFQTKGRGQRNNSWDSQRSKNLLFSFLLSPKIPVQSQFYIHVIISISIYNTLKKIGLSGITIKWPNDIYINNLKIAGILVENIVFKKKVSRSVIGIGININQTNFLNLKATSVINESGEYYDKNKILKILLSNIEKEYKKININKDAMFKQYKKLLFGYNQNLDFDSGGKIFQGKIIDLEKNGNLILCINNKKVSFEHGSLSLL